MARTPAAGRPDGAARPEHAAGGPQLLNGPPDAPICTFVSLVAAGRRVAATRPGRLLSAVAAAVLAVPLAAAPASAAVVLPQPTVDCVIVSGNWYLVVLGYRNATAQTVSVPVGSRNRLRPAGIDGRQPTTFQPGWHPGALLTPPLPVTESVSWTIGTSTVTATAGSPRCGPQVSLPAEGNGIGPVLVLVGSVLLSVAVGAVRKRRRPRPAA
jgi:hypothetical protein